MRKKVALLIPHHFSFYEAIMKNLEILDYEVVLLILTDKEFRYKNFFERLGNFLKKTFLNDKGYKSQLRVKRNSENLKIEIAKISEKIDYTLVIRPDYFTKNSLKLLKNKSKLFTAYQWDGFQRYPEIVNYIDLFDRFFVFDRSDYNLHKESFANLFPITNFYIDYFDDEGYEVEEVYFLGSYLENRIEEIVSISNFFEKSGIKSNIQIVCSKEKDRNALLTSSIHPLTHSLKYSEMIKQVQKSKFLLEFNNLGIHDGLSFRVFEALGFKKKLITNNPEVLNYDFYHPNNIFVWDGRNYHEIIAFLKKDYKELDSVIYKKYSFSNWIRYVFDEMTYIPINF